ncbi:MAG: arsenosugar biosynthesis radical SAM protein ArsS [Planctomycetes bacterium]|nr:arsenosugar biosynthesis radical SAM protein ArsS [Planctomycetota bacterium]
MSNTQHVRASFDEACGRYLRPRSIDTIQVNIGAACNLACRHCHVQSSPRRTESMSWETMQSVLDAATKLKARCLDITGGAPELHPGLRGLVAEARARRLRVMLRTNLTILLQPEHADLPAFFADNEVHLIASLPCYSIKNVEVQRGAGVFGDSIDALRVLNGYGYGKEATLPLDLVYNPAGMSLPPPEATLEQDYRRELSTRFGVEFSHLYVMANMPIGRFARDLERDGDLESYIDKLRAGFNPATVDALMCRSQLHVGWDGQLSDCDFNFVLGLSVDRSAPQHIRDVNALALHERRIRTGDHCFGCTAGQGSSCAGALT